jgi:hypothetical protein
LVRLGYALPELALSASRPQCKRISSTVKDVIYDVKGDTYNYNFCLIYVQANQSLGVKINITHQKHANAFVFVQRYLNGRLNQPSTRVRLQHAFVCTETR